MCLRNERTKGLTKPEIGVKLVLQALRPLGYIGTWEPEDDETKGLKNMSIICAYIHAYTHLGIYIHIICRFIHLCPP